MLLQFLFLGMNISTWTISSDSGAKHSAVSQHWSKFCLPWHSLMGWEPSHALSLLSSSSPSTFSFKHSSWSAVSLSLTPRKARLHYHLYGRDCPCAHCRWYQHLDPNPHRIIDWLRPIAAPVLHVWLRASWKCSDILQLEHPISSKQELDKASSAARNYKKPVENISEF